MVERDAAARLGRILEAHELLARVAAQLGPDLDLTDVLSTVLTAMRKLADFRGGTVQLVDERGVYIAAADPPADSDVAALRVRVGEGLSGRVVATGQPMSSNDLDLDSRVSASVRNAGGNAEIRSYLAVPLICLGETIGALQIDSVEPNAFGDDDITLLEGLAAQVAGVIESARRYATVMELERLKSDFISRVSHELRTPITIVDGFVATMLDHGGRLDEEQRHDMLQRCRSATARLSRLIEELITLARLETGVITAHVASTDLHRLLGEVVNAASDPRAVEVVCRPNLRVHTDAELLRRALGFLVDNALKYGDRALITVADDGSFIEINDRGPGIPDDVRDAVFELFTRGRSTTQVPGLGLGLPMARTLLGAIGADLDLRPLDGGDGTTVRVILDASAQSVQ